MTQEEKIREILDRHFGHHVVEGSDEWYTRNYQNRFLDLQVIAEWKDEQFAKERKELIAKANQAVIKSFENGAKFMEERLIEKMENCVKKLYLPAYSYKDRENEELINDIKEAMMEG
jgi:hypothetical protein